MMRKYFIIALCGLMTLPVFAAKRKVHTIGDSTMAEYKPAATPKRGWGMYLQAFFDADSIQVNNRGKSGASTRTFYETENLWPSVKKQMHAGDYLIIQFAHNDEKCKGEDVYIKNSELKAAGQPTLTDFRGTNPNTTYKEYLRMFIREARELGVTPILMSPICRAYFTKSETINPEGRHVLAEDKDYVRSMREVAKEMNVPFLDMTLKSQEMYESMGRQYCMDHYFNCGDKTHTGQEGGMMIAHLAYLLIKEEPELSELHPLINQPSVEYYSNYVRTIEENGKKAALAANGKPFSQQVSIAGLKNIEKQWGGYVPTGGLWPAGEIDEVANRYIEYTIAPEKKIGRVIETITLLACAKGGDGMNIHVNYGLGDSFRGVTTIYENTALPKNKPLVVKLDQPILLPAGEALHIRVLPWYDSNGSPQKGHCIQLGELRITGKKLL